MEVLQCKHCGKEQAFQMTRMVKHLRDKCVTAPENLKEMLKNIENTEDAVPKKRKPSVDLESQEHDSANKEVAKS